MRKYQFDKLRYAENSQRGREPVGLAECALRGGVPVNVRLDVRRFFEGRHVAAIKRSSSGRICSS